MRFYVVFASLTLHSEGYDACFGPFTSRLQAERTVTAISHLYRDVSISEVDPEAPLELKDRRKERTN